MRWNGITAALLNLTSSPAMPGIASRRAISSSIASGDPATVPLMPFGGDEQRALDAAAAAEGGERLAQRAPVQSIRQKR